jgi:acetyl-CoA C-acetyltransferase
MVTSTEPRPPIAVIVASISALRRTGSIPILGIRVSKPKRRLILIDVSIKKNMIGHGAGFRAARRPPQAAPRNPRLRISAPSPVRAFNRFSVEQFLAARHISCIVGKEVPLGDIFMTAAIVGWAHSRFGKLEDETLESMIVKVATEALEHAGIGPDDVDEIVLGHFNAGFSPQDFTASLVLQADDRLRFKPATRVENACATGSAAVRQGIRAIEANAARIVLVVGAEQMTKTPGPEIGQNLLRASYLPEDGDTPAGFAGVFGKIAAAYFQRHGDQSDALARIAAKNHKNGVDNPYAQMRKDFGYDFCRAESEKNPYVAGPLKRTDCSLVSDGAAAIVLADMSTALSMRRAVAFRANEHVQDFLPMSKRDILLFEGCSVAWGQALEKARLTLDDLSFVETHDCFTIAELIEYEAMGLAKPGQGARVVAEGITEKNGRLPVNPSGGLKAKGHPIGATGVSMHALTAAQLMGEAGGIQVEGAKLGGIFNMGGAAVANYVSILERVK